EKICSVIKGSFIQYHKNYEINYLVYDSRKVQQASKCIFFAIHSSHNDGHKFIGDAYHKGVRNFVVSSKYNYDSLNDCNIIIVHDVITALQDAARFHREQFDIPIIAITGSNGKTIVKEWLTILLQNDYTIVRSPKSFNSQIGVPLSIWQINNHHTLGIFEAGISMPGEMGKLESIIQPQVGIFTNLG